MTTMMFNVKCTLLQVVETEKLLVQIVITGTAEMQRVQKERKEVNLTPFGFNDIRSQVYCGPPKAMEDTQSNGRGACQIWQRQQDTANMRCTQSTTPVMVLMHVSLQHCNRIVGDAFDALDEMQNKTVGRMSFCMSSNASHASSTVLSQRCRLMSTKTNVWLLHHVKGSDLLAVHKGIKIQCVLLILHPLVSCVTIHVICSLPFLTCQTIWANLLLLMAAVPFWCCVPALLLAWLHVITVLRVLSMVRADATVFESLSKLRYPNEGVGISISRPVLLQKQHGVRLLAGCTCQNMLILLPW